MEIIGFLKVISRQKFVLIAVPLITVIITYFLVRQLPSVYTSKARLATGLVDDSKKAPANLDFLAAQGESMVNQQFNNLIQTIQLQKMYDQVSYKLILHDLTVTPDSMYRRPSKLLLQLNKAARAHAIDVYSDLYRRMEPLSLWDADQFGLNTVLVSMGYDEGSLKKNMAVYRVNTSDFVDIQFESENPILSAFAANTLAREFTIYYTNIFRENQVRSMNFLDSLQKMRQASVDKQMLELKNYKIENKILNLNEQARILYNQIADFETRREVAMKDVESYSGALKNLEQKFNPKDRQYLESTSTKINQDILSTTDLLKAANDAYIRSNYDERLKGRVDTLKNQITDQLNQSADRYDLNPLQTKQNIVIQKAQLEVSLDLARYSIVSLQSELDRLNRKFNGLVPHEAMIQSYEKSIDNAGKEYLDVLGKFNQTSMESNFAAQLKQIEVAMPGSPGPSKKMLLVILSGLISLFFCLAVLFILFFLDDDVHVSRQLANSIGIPVMGYLPRLDRSLLDLKKLWNEIETRPSEEPYRNLLRAIRFEIDSEMEGAKTLAITSMRPEEGKTFLALSLAYAYSMTGKKVLLIDGNFDSASISKAVKPAGYLEDILQGTLPVAQLGNESKITVLGNREADISLFELTDEDNVRRHLQSLKEAFDIILIESPALSALGKSKEWIVVADKAVAVFEADQRIGRYKQMQINYLKSLDNKFIGWVMNKVKSR